MKREICTRTYDPATGLTRRYFDDGTTEDFSDRSWEVAEALARGGLVGAVEVVGRHMAEMVRGQQ